MTEQTKPKPKARVPRPDAVERAILGELIGKPVVISLVTGDELRCVLLGADTYSLGVKLRNGTRALVPKEGYVLIRPDKP